jgi:alkylated DNA nucleotide flippase Atl1
MATETTTAPTLGISHFVLSHIPWVVLVVCAVIGFYSWRGEHDGRLIAEAKVKADEQQVQVLQTNIAQNNQAIASLQQQMEQRDAVSAKQIANLVGLVQKVQTVSQAVAALPQVSTLPVAPTIQADNSVVFPSADVLPLFQQLADGATCKISLATAQADLTSEKAIEAKDESTIADMTKQIALKDDEIKTLKKPKGFWKRVGGTLKSVGIGIGIGVALGHRI